MQHCNRVMKPEWHYEEKRSLVYTVEETIPSNYKIRKGKYKGKDIEPPFCLLYTSRCV